MNSEDRVWINGKLSNKLLGSSSVHDDLKSLVFQTGQKQRNICKVRWLAGKSPSLIGDIGDTSSSGSIVHCHLSFWVSKETTNQPTNLDFQVSHSLHGGSSSLQRWGCSRPLRKHQEFPHVFPENVWPHGRKCFTRFTVDKKPGWICSWFRWWNFFRVYCHTLDLPPTQ